MEQEYCGALYNVNGHNEIGGSEYNRMAYVLVMHPGNRLRELRKKARKSQQELAAATGLSQPAVSQLENGTRPMTLEWMRAFARELGCSVSDLLDDKDNPDRLGEEERALLQAYRDIPSSARNYILMSAQAVAEREAGDLRKAS